MRSLALLAFCLVGCGYHVTGSGPGVPAGAHTISIKLFHNPTRERGLEVLLRQAIEEEFQRRGPLRIVPDGEGDLVLSGAIRRVINRPVAFSANDEAVAYQSVIVVAVRMVERESGRVVFDTRTLQESQDFGAVSGVVISSSPHFQQGLMDAQDIANLTDVQVSETRRRAANQQLLQLLAQDIYLDTMEGF